MNWDDLRYLHAIAEKGTLQGSAETLGVHASTVLRRLDQIERSLEVRLFDRHREGISLTAAGEEALEVAQKMSSEVDDLERRLMGRDTRPRGTVRITTTDTLFNNVLGPILSEFRSVHPGIRLEVILGNPFLSLSKRDADIALRPTDSPPETLVGRRITDIAAAVYGASSCLSATAPDRPLEKHAWIVPDDSLSHLASARWLRKNLGKVEPVMRVNSVEAMFRAARSGSGVAILPCFMGDAAAELERLGDPLPEAATGLWLLTHHDLRHVARIRALLDHLYDALNSRRCLFTGS